MKAIGIDLGTTNSCIAVVENGQAKIISNSEGKNTIPSVVFYKNKNEVLVGELAKRQTILHPKTTIHSIKRFIGNNFGKISELGIQYQFDLIEKNEEPFVLINDDEVSPQEISAEILKKLKKDAEQYLGEKISDVVITVPAYFDDTQRQATRLAGKIAGLNVLRIINEPTSAALAFGIDKLEFDKELKVAVFDLGGGTFDISILELEKNEKLGAFFKVLSTSGDNYLGGNDFDKVLSDHIISSFEKENQIKLNAEALSRILEATEKLKIELSTSLTSEINLPYITVKDNKPLHLSMTISRNLYEDLAKDLLIRIEDPCLQAVKDANINITEIDQVILIGGMTRTPFIQEKVRDIFKCKVRNDMNPDESVAMGAALQCDLILNKNENVTLVDVIPLSIGVKIENGLFSPIINRNTAIPSRVSQRFTTSEDGQEDVEIAIYQGERVLADENRFLGKLVLENIPPMPKGIPVISVTLEVTNDGVLMVSAEDENQSSQISATLETYSGLSQEEIAKILEESESKREIDESIVELNRYRSFIERIILLTKNTLIETDCDEKYKDYLKQANLIITTNLSDIEDIKDYTNKVKAFYVLFGKAYYQILNQKTEKLKSS